MAKNKGNNMSADRENLSAEETLDMLAAMAEEDLRNRENDYRSRPAKKNKSKTKEPPKETVPEENPQAQEPKKKKKRKSSQQKASAQPMTDYEENPFTAFAERMSEAGRALEKREYEESDYDEPEEYDDEEPEAAPPGTRRDERREAGRSKRLSGQDHIVGEEISRKKAEQLIAKGKTNKELGGRRATIIVRRTVVDTSGNLVKDPDPDIYRGGEDEVYEQEPPKAGPPRKDPVLLLIRDDTGEAFSLDEDLTIGREDDNDICIPEPEGHYVAGYHAEIQIKGRDIYLKDKGSTNGTFVNGSRISSKRIRSGQTIKFADISFSVEED